MGSGFNLRVVGGRGGLGAFRKFTLAGALALLIVSAVVSLRTADARRDRHIGDDLAHSADRQSQALDAYFARAREINLLIAQNPALIGTVGSHQRGHTHGDANAVLAYLDTLYPGQISEACVIGIAGVETARVVGSRHAAPDELSEDEAANPFFAPTLAIAPGVVYQATPYISPDTHEWVISNSTPVLDGSGRKTAILHFEVTLASFGSALRATDSATTTQILDARTGTVILDSRLPSGVALTSDGAAPPSFPGTTADADFTRDGTRYSVRHVAAAPGNANRWVVVSSASISGAAVSWGAIGIESLLLILAALTLLTVVGLGFRADRRRLLAAAVTDPLSGLPNRVLFADQTAQAIEDAQRRGHRVAIALLDLDRFKEVNDTLGHQAGDLLLQEVARRLRDSVGDKATIARLGGDEFALLFPSVGTPSGAAGATRTMLEALREPVQVGDAQVGVTASAGLALWPEHGDSVDELLKRADIAMYRAKRTAAAVLTYRPEFDVHTPERLALMADLRTAIERGQMTLEYQPKVDLALQQVVGVEALVRWRHPLHGLLAPGVFLPLVTELGLDTTLTQDVLRQALGQCRRWVDMGLSLQMAVNLPACCVQDPATVDMVTRELDRWGVPARHLRLEITETSFVGDTSHALEVLLRLEAAGITLSIDDYGTGYSSLAYLKRLPVHELKIDRAFIRELAEHTTDADIVRSTIDLGHRLGFTVVAEGVEQASAAALLAEAGCDVVQGFLYSRPLPPEAFIGWLQTWERANANLAPAGDPVAPSIAGPSG